MNRKERDKMFREYDNDYPRCHYNKDHSLKRPFNDFRSARNFIENSPMMDADNYDIYRCWVCGKCHLSTIKKKEPTA